MSVQEIIAEAQNWPEPMGVFIVIGGSHGLSAEVANAIEAADGKVIVFDAGGPLHPGVTFFEVDFHSFASVQEAVDLVLEDFATVDGVVAVASDDSDLAAVGDLARAMMETLSKVDGKVVIIGDGAVGTEHLAQEIAFESQNHVRAKVLDASVSTQIAQDVVEVLSTQR